MALIIPEKYRLKLLPETTEIAIKLIKDAFQQRLAKALNLRRVTAPLFVLSGTGLNDDLNGVEKAVSFPVKSLGGKKAEVVHSLAKWKRSKLAAYGVVPGFGIYTDMNAIRADEELDNLHSIYVDQWDWEQAIRESDRSLDYLVAVVRKIYAALKETEQMVYERFPHITPVLPDDIAVVHSEELLQIYPALSPKEREAEIARKYGAVFIVGIGADLSDGKPHDGRAPDYDDWITPNSAGYRGLNGDILLWNPVQCGVADGTVESARMRRTRRIAFPPLVACRWASIFHRRGNRTEPSVHVPAPKSAHRRGTSQWLQKAHIGEVQASVWPEEQIEECRRHNIYLM